MSHLALSKKQENPNQNASAETRTNVISIPGQLQSAKSKNFTLMIMTEQGVEAFEVTAHESFGSLDKMSMLTAAGYQGDIDDVINVICGPSQSSSDVYGSTALNHFEIQVLTDNPENSSFSFHKESNLDLTQLSPSQLLTEIDTSSVVGDIFHVCCRRILS